MEPRRAGLGRCAHFFWLGVAFDAVGVAVLLTGVFADLLFYDALLYLGSIIIFVSVLWWVSWYSGNVEMLPEELPDGAARAPAPAAPRRRRSRPSLSLSGVSCAFLRVQRRRPRRPSAPAAPGRLEKDGRDEDGSDPRDGGAQSGGAGPGGHCDSPRWVWPVLPSGPSPSSGTLASGSPPGDASGRPVTASTSRSPSALGWDARAPGLPRPAASQDPLLAPVAAGSLPCLSGGSSSQSGTSTISLNCPLERAVSQSHIQLPQASLGQIQNLPPASRTQLPHVKDSGSQTLVTQVPMVPFVFVQTLQSVGPQGTPVAQEVHGTSSDQVSQSHPKGVLEASRKPVAETLPPHGQKLSHEQPGAAPPEATLPATQARRSDPPGKAPAWRQSHP